MGGNGTAQWEASQTREPVTQLGQSCGERKSVAKRGGRGDEGMNICKVGGEPGGQRGGQAGRTPGAKRVCSGVTISSSWGMLL